MGNSQSTVNIYSGEDDVLKQIFVWAVGGEDNTERGVIKNSKDVIETTLEQLKREDENSRDQIGKKRVRPERSFDKQKYYIIKLCQNYILFPSETDLFEEAIEKIKTQCTDVELFRLLDKFEKKIIETAKKKAEEQAPAPAEAEAAENVYQLFQSKLVISF